MGNHESFLKMIGLEREVDPAVEGAKPTSTQEESWSALMPANEGSTPEPEAEDSLPEALATEWPEPEAPIESEPSASHSNSNTEWDVPPEQESKTESAFRFAPEPTDHTVVYTNVERERISSPRRMTTSKAITLSQLLSRTKSPDGTRPTVAFDYDAGESEDASSGGTAHFDYSKEQSDHRIVTLEGNVNAQAFHLGNLPLRFGRDPANEVVLDDVNTSRFHAEIRDEGNQIAVVDLSSTNGIKVNGELVTHQILQGHDVIQIGDCLFEYLLPGVLSKGKPLAAVVAGELSETPYVIPARNRILNKRNILIAAGLVIVCFGYLFLSNAPEMAAEKIKAIASQQAQVELNTLKSSLEQKFQKPIAELKPEEVRTAFLDHFQGSPLLSLLPENAASQITNLPPEILQIFVSEPELLSQVVNQGADQEAVSNVLKSKLNTLIVRKQMSAALVLIGALIQLHPEDGGLKEAQEKLKIYADSQAAKEDATGLSPDEKKFYEYMEQHENFVMKLIDDKRLDDALEFSKVVSKNVADLIVADKKFQKVGSEEVKRWEDRTEDLTKKLSVREEKKKESAAFDAEGRQILDRIKASMNIGDYAEVQKLIQEFMKDYPGHADRGELMALQGEALEHLEKSFMTTKESIQRLLDQEGYENAWKELYRFLEVMPEHPQAKVLRTNIETMAGPRAAQYYNQARVYEFEADDLVAAEQYYKRTLEISDPRGELHKKAARRYAEVKRRTIQ